MPVAKSIDKLRRSKFNPITSEISLCPNCYCMTYDIVGSDGIYCGKCKTLKTSSRNLEDNDGK